MANTSSAKKSALQSIKRASSNLARRTSIKTAVKKVLAAIENGDDAARLQELIGDVASQLSRAQSKKVMHKNTASRKLSRLALRVAQASRTNAPKAQA